MSGLKISWRAQKISHGFIKTYMTELHLHVCTSKCVVKNERNIASVNNYAHIQNIHDCTHSQMSVGLKVF